MRISGPLIGDFDHEGVGEIRDRRISIALRIMVNEMLDRGDEFSDICSGRWLNYTCES